MKKELRKKTKSYDEGLFQDLKNPETAVMFLNSCLTGLSEDDFEIFWDAIETVVKANGTSKTAFESGVSRDALYKSFKDHRNPRLKSFRKILNAIGFDMAIVPILRTT